MMKDSYSASLTGMMNNAKSAFTPKCLCSIMLQVSYHASFKSDLYFYSCLILGKNNNKCKTHSKW